MCKSGPGRENLHVRRVQRHTVALARALGITEPIEIKAIEAAALLHDIGKLGVPDKVLNKPGALSQSEFEQIKLHVNAGATILSAVEFSYPVVPIVRGHHAQWNGRGYPDGLAGSRAERPGDWHASTRPGGHPVCGPPEQREVAAHRLGGEATPDTLIIQDRSWAK